MSGIIAFACELSPRNAVEELSSFRAKVQKFRGSIFMFVYARPSQCLVKRWGLGEVEINLSTHSTAMPSISNVCLLLFSVPFNSFHSQQWSKFSMFVFLQNVYASERKAMRNFLAIFYHKIKLLFLYATKRSEKMLHAQLKFLILFFPFPENNVEKS